MVVNDLHVHLVFLTVLRRDALTEAMLVRCQEVMREVCAGFGAELIAFTGTDDHVRLHVRYPAGVAISRLVNSLKGVSSRLLRKEFDQHVAQQLGSESLWSPSYYAGCSADAPEGVLTRYLDSQRRGAR